MPVTLSKRARPHCGSLPCFVVATSTFKTPSITSVLSVHTRGTKRYLYSSRGVQAACPVLPPHHTCALLSRLLLLRVAIRLT